MMSSTRSQQQHQLAALEQKLSQVRGEAERLHMDIQRQKDQLFDSDLSVLGKSVQALGKQSLRQRRLLRGHTTKVTSVEWFADSERLASVAQDGRLFVWDGPSANKLQAITLKSSWVMSLGISSTGKFVACGGLDNIVSVYDLKEAEAEAQASSGPKGSTVILPRTPKRELTSHIGFIAACKFVGDNQMISASGDQSCILWDVEKGQKITVFNGHLADVMGLALMIPRTQDSASATTFVSVSGDTTARLWDIRSGDCHAIYEGHRKDISCVDAFPDGNAFASGAEDGVIRLFDVRAGRELLSYGPVSQDPREIKSLTSVAFTNSGRGIFASYEDPNIRLWDAFTGQCRTIISASDKDHRVSHLCVSPDGNALATSSWDSFIKIWA